MTFVLDASMAVSWYFDDEATPLTEAVLDQVAECGAVVPVLWRFEVANAFLSAVRRDRMTVRYRDEALSGLAQLPISVDADSGLYAWTTTLALSDRFSLTVYDAAYLELAQRRSLPLATLDLKLRDAAITLGYGIAEPDMPGYPT
jgi:predicted nucleic acid-binding protein